MRLDGIYTGDNVNIPDGIRTWGPPAEYDRVGPLPMRDPAAIPPAQQRATHEGNDGTCTDGVVPPYCMQDIPADKNVVQRIARATEVQCSDPRLIDWMRAQG